jgi:hypothetical protein
VIYACSIASLLCCDCRATYNNRYPRKAKSPPARAIGGTLPEKWPDHTWVRPKERGRVTVFTDQITRRSRATEAFTMRQDAVAYKAFSLQGNFMRKGLPERHDPQRIHA